MLTLHLTYVTFSYSKLLLWTGFYYIASRLSHHNKGYARLSFSGTVAPTIPTKVSNFLKNKM